MLANVRMSACRPAPPVGSDAANVITIGGKSGSLSAGIAGAALAAGNAEIAQPWRRVPFGRLARIAGFYSNGSRQRLHTMKKYMCLICGWIYDEAVGAPEEGIAPGTKWDDVPPNWTCPECGA